MIILGTITLFIGLLLLLFVNILLGGFLMLLGALFLIIGAIQQQGPARTATQREIDVADLNEAMRRKINVTQLRAERAAAERATERKPCPMCAELILPAAKICPHCKTSLDEGWAAPKPLPQAPLPEHMRAYYEAKDQEKSA